MARLLKAILFMSLVFYLFSCEKHTLLGPNPTVDTGLSFTEEKLLLSSGEYIYRQSCNVETKDAKALHFAYKITTLKAEPLPGFSTDAEGWLIFAGFGIWTFDSQLSIDFTSVQGKIEDLITGVQVKIKHSDGQIEELESSFKSSRLISSWIEVSFSSGAQVPAGLEFPMKESIGDIYVDGMYAHHFMYRLNILNEALDVIQAGSWYSSIDSPDIRKVHLSLNTTPALNFNAPGTFTQFECYVVSRTGVEQDGPTSIYFQVVEGNQPVALIYPQTFLGQGQYHYSIVNDTPAYMINPIPPNGDRHNREFWTSNYGLEAINSQDFKLHLRWGYSGQYGNISFNGDLVVTNNPFDREMNHVLNPSGINYHGHITAFWLRLDGAPFPAQAQFFNPQIITDSEGNSWLRVANFNDNCRHCILQNLDSGNHVVELKVEDLQGVLSETAQKIFNLYAYKTPQQRSGILVIDGSPNNPNNSPEAFVDAFYTAVTPTAWGPVNQADLSVIASGKISSVALQNYRAVLMHSDNPSTGMDLRAQVDALEIYLGNQGNLIWSGTSQMANRLGDIPPDFRTSRLGISNLGGISTISSFSHSFFINAIGQMGLDDIPLNLSYPFNPMVNVRQGFSSLTLFDPSLNLDWLYAFGCKPVDHPTFPPTQEQYDLYSSKYVTYKYENNGSSVVVFGFPLSYMEQTPVANSLNTLFDDILGNSVAQRRNK
ncbi:MAG: hypothetical protein PHG34_02185 [Candidatus Cloacimonetes bacterium]|nr:hypothetical protein [Candidatus Cloacimonadota bacterium]